MSYPMIAWLSKPYDPELAADAAEAFEGLPDVQRLILDRQAAFDPSLHLVVDDTFPAFDVGKDEWAVYCTQGHRFTGPNPLVAYRAAEAHVEASRA